MRRKDKEITGKELFQELADTVLVGYLGLVQGDEYPRSIPLNFVLMGEAIYFHGARAGEKYDLLSSDPKASFCIPQVLSYIPSTFLGGDACEASHFYRSAMIYGRGDVVSDLDEKHSALVALMEKYQPGVEANRMDMSNKKLDKTVSQTAVFKLGVKRVVMKENLGGHMTDEQKQMVKEALLASGKELDHQTAKLL